MVKNHTELEQQLAQLKGRMNQGGTVTASR